jgi:histone-lysine N-methyltransferase SETMAR
MEQVPSFEILRSYVMMRTALGDTPDDIDTDFTDLYGDKRPSRGFIYKWMDYFRQGRESTKDLPRCGRAPARSNLPQEILDALESQPFGSVRSLSDDLDAPRETIRRTLIDILQMHKFKCKWVPYKLTPDQKRARVTLAKEMLDVFQNVENLKNTITCDQAWFYHENPIDGQWATSSKKVHMNPRRTIRSAKVMVTVFWGYYGIYVINQKDDSIGFDANYMCELLEELDENFAQRRPVNGLCGMFIHMDNARPHTAKMTQKTISQLDLQPLEHPAYSPDLAPTDFFLWGYVKEQLKGYNFDTSDDLFAAIVSIIEGITREMRQRVLSKWVERLKTVIRTRGEYIID